MGAVELLSAYKEVGLGGLFLVSMFLIIKYQARMNEKCNEDQRKILDDHKEDFKNVAIQMFEVVNANTQAKTELKEAVRQLASK